MSAIHVETRTTGSPDLSSLLQAVRRNAGQLPSLRLSYEDLSVPLTPEVSAAIVSFLEALDRTPAAGLPDEITTGQAADLLGVTRPTVVSLIDRGELPALRVGSHRRLKTADVVAFLEAARSGRRAALDEIVAISEELGLYDEP